MISVARTTLKYDQHKKVQKGSDNVEFLLVEPEAFWTKAVELSETRQREKEWEWIKISTASAGRTERGCKVP